MKKGDCEKAIRSLCSKYADERDVPIGVGQPNFSDFVTWLREQGYGQYLDFRSTMGPMYDAEMWFDDEFKQNWRN